MKHAHWTFILTEKHLLRPPLYTTSKTMSESQDIQMDMQMTSSKIIQKAPVPSSLTGREMNLLCYAYYYMLSVKLMIIVLNSCCVLK